MTQEVNTLLPQWVVAAFCCYRNEHVSGVMLSNMNSNTRTLRRQVFLQLGPNVNVVQMTYMLASCVTSMSMSPCNAAMTLVTRV